MGLQKAFRIVFEMRVTSKSLSSIQIGKRYGIRQGTAWYFMQKVRKAMQSSQKYPLQEIIHVDEFTVELTNKHQVKRVYVKSIDDYSAQSFTPIFEEHISTSAQIITDKWRGYEPLKKQYNMEQKLSNKGRNFKELHIIIHQIKS